jgi:hypothetical protein
MLPRSMNKQVAQVGRGRIANGVTCQAAGYHNLAVEHATVIADGMGTANGAHSCNSTYARCWQREAYAI